MQMARTVPTVQGEILTWRERGEENSVKVGSFEWHSWLSTATGFSFVSPEGTFWAYQDRSGDYWRAYRKVSGKARRAYLGKAARITLERLNEVAVALAVQDSGALALGQTASGDVSRSVYAGLASNTVARVDSKPQSGPQRLSDSIFLSTKLLRPVVRTDLVERPRLTERVSRAFHCPLTLISAPAGSGKTTLLGQWIAQSRSPVAWVTLDSGDNEPTRFWAYIISALQTLRLHLGGDVLMMLRSSELPPLESYLSVLTNAVAAEQADLAIVLDDYHFIVDQTVHKSVAFLLDHLPPNLHLIIATRTDPPLSLARLRVRGQLCELRAGDLKFTLEETTSFLNEVMRLNVSAEDVAALVRRSEGWTAGLQVAALSMQQSDDVHGFVQAFSGSHRHVTDYLGEEVLRRQPENVQRFLLRTAILERLNGPLCEAVVGLSQGEGQASLEMLERANLFTVPMDDERHWYRYHGFFASCLQTELRRSDPGRVSDLHRKAFLWYAENGLVTEAVGHALAAGEVESAADLIEQLAAVMWKHGEAVTLFGWFRELPSEVMRRRPMLCVWHANALLSTGQADAAEERLRHAELALGLSHDAAPLGGVAESAQSPNDIRRAHSHILATRAAIAAFRHDAPLTIALARQSIEQDSGEDEYQRGRMLGHLGRAYSWTGDVVRANEALTEAVRVLQSSENMLVALAMSNHLAYVQAIQGHLRQAEANYTKAVRFATERHNNVFLVGGWPSLGLALLHYEWNELGMARTYATEGIDVASQWEMADMLLFSQGILARVRQAEGDLEGALSILSEAAQLARTNDADRELARIEAHRARLWLLQGNVEAAARWMQACGLSADDELQYSREGNHMTLARVLTAQGRAAEAARLLERLLQSAESAGRVGNVIGILGIQALALQVLGQTNNALSVLMRALWLAEPEGYVRTFVDSGTPMAALLSRLLEARHREPSSPTRRASVEYIRSLLAAFEPGAFGLPGARGRARAIQATEALLSERELEVLRLIEAGNSPLEISRALVVSRNTVKSHMRSIYDKLEAHSAPAAVAKAKVLKLI
ncbi:MAG: helix-turn-helix transcriptional regulator [Chloroflexota bacterium]|nr:MAG: helix-turn-helix transcriptional regulator [Chloroflexota bacterium]